MPSTPRTRRTLLAAALALPLIAAPLAFGQPCTPALQSFPTGPLDITQQNRAVITSMLPFNDGSGPALYVGGQYLLPPSPTTTYAGCFVSRYQHGQWSPLSTGLPATQGFVVNALAAADFSSVGGPGPSLYCAGTNQSNVYRFNGTQVGGWVATGPVPGTTVHTLLQHTDAQGPVLLASSNVGSVYAWRGSGAWSQYAPLGGTGAVLRLRVVDDGTGPSLFAMGTFRDDARGLYYIAKFVNGQWTPFPLPSVTSLESIYDLTSYDDGTHGPELYITGLFNLPGTSGAGVARRRNGNWELANARVQLQPDSRPTTFYKVNEGSGEQLYITGAIDQNPLYSGVARLTPTGWQAPIFVNAPVGATQTYGAVYTMARFDDGQGPRTYLAGFFDSFRTAYGTVNPGSPAYSFIRSAPTASGYEGGPLGVGETFSAPPPTVRYDLVPITTPDGPRLFIGGNFFRAGGQGARNAALFDGNAFTPLSTPTGSVQYVQRAAVAPYQGQPRIFATAPASSLGLVCWWDGTQWVRLTSQPPGGNAIALATFNNTLYALTDLGLFRMDANLWTNLVPWSGASAAYMDDANQRLLFCVNGSSGPGIYQFNGAAVTLVATTVSSQVGAICVHDDGSGPTLYIAGNGVSGGVQRRVNGSWQMLPSGQLSFFGLSTISMASFDDGRGPALYLAGPFTQAGGVPVNGFARWRDNAWTPAGPYMAQQNGNGLTRATLAVFNNRLYLAGEFTNIGSLNADHLAWIDPCPYICSADFNHDGDTGTDQDIEALFACLGGNCCTRCTADFNNDGDTGTDQDIESFFRVLGGGAC